MYVFMHKNDVNPGYLMQSKLFVIFHSMLLSNKIYIRNEYTTLRRNQHDFNKI